MNWEQVRLGDICESRLGKTMNASTDTGEVRQYLCAVNVKWDEFDFSTLKNAPFSTDEIKKYTVQKGDLLICEGGDTGRAAIWNKEEPIQYQNALHRVRFRDGTAVPRFCLHFLHYLKLSGILDKEYSHGATILHLVTKSLYSITMPLPPITEQQRIVEVLDAEFAKIDALKANAEKNLQNAKDLFQASLKKELEPKEGWRTMKLGEFAHMKAGDFVKASDIHSDYFEGSYPCFGGNGFRGYVAEPNKNGEYCLIGRQGALCGNVHIASGTFRATEHAVVVTPREPIPVKLTYYLLVSMNLNQYSTGAAQPGLSVGNIAERAFISVPPQEDYERIVKCLEAIKNTCESLQENYTKTIALCNDLKQALLRKAFNGEL